MRLFGSLLIARYGVASLGRQRVPPALRTPHTLYVDEVQNFDTSSLRGIPAEGRKFGLWIVMATQYLKGLGIELQSAIRANVATVMLLQPSPEDARPLADLVAPLTERDLVNLPRFRTAIRKRGRLTRSRSVSGATRSARGRASSGDGWSSITVATFARMALWSSIPRPFRYCVAMTIQRPNLRPSAGMPRSELVSKFWTSSTYRVCGVRRAGGTRWRPSEATPYRAMRRLPNRRMWSRPTPERSTRRTSPASMIWRGRIVETGALTIARIEG